MVETVTGWVWCTKGMRQSDFTPYGVGVTLYFQFLKFLCSMFFILTVLNIPAYIFFYSGNNKDTSGDLKSGLA